MLVSHSINHLKSKQQKIDPEVYDLKAFIDQANYKVYFGTVQEHTRPIQGGQESVEGKWN